MTEKKQLRKQLPANPSQQRVRSAHHVHSVQSSRSNHSAHSTALTPRTLKRVVTVPQSADTNAAWDTFAQRQRKLRKARSQFSREQQPVLVARTFRQMGVRATSGRIQAVRRPLPYRATAIPVRSGHKRLRRRSVLRIVLCIVGLIIVLALLYFFLFSTIFRVQVINVSGTQSSMLLNEVQHMNIKGQNIFLCDIGSIQARLAASPLVASVIVKKQWPATLEVVVTERKSAILWQTSQGIYSVAQDGMVIAPASQSIGTGQLGTVIDESVSDSTHKAEPLVRPGTYLKHADIVFANQVLQQVPAVTGVNVSKLYYNGTMYASTTNAAGGGGRRGSYNIESPDGWTAYLGGAQDANTLANRLQELREVLNLARRQHEQIAIIDLRYGLRPVYIVQK
jgi:cell division septal protein FtsQ